MIIEYIQNFKFKNLFITGCSYVEYLELEKKHRKLTWWELLYIWYYDNFEYIILIIGGILIIIMIYYHLNNNSDNSNNIDNNNNIDNSNNINNNIDNNIDNNYKITIQKGGTLVDKQFFNGLENMPNNPIIKPNSKHISKHISKKKSATISFAKEKAKQEAKEKAEKAEKAKQEAKEKAEEAKANAKEKAKLDKEFKNDFKNVNRKKAEEKRIKQKMAVMTPRQQNEYIKKRNTKQNIKNALNDKIDTYEFSDDLSLKQKLSLSTAKTKRSYQNFKKKLSSIKPKEKIKNIFKNSNEVKQTKKLKEFNNFEKNIQQNTKFSNNQKRNVLSEFKTKLDTKYMSNDNKATISANKKREAAIIKEKQQDVLTDATDSRTKQAQKIVDDRQAGKDASGVSAIVTKKLAGMTDKQRTNYLETKSKAETWKAKKAQLKNDPEAWKKYKKSLSLKDISSIRLAVKTQAIRDTKDKISATRDKVSKSTIGKLTKPFQASDVSQESKKIEAREALNKNLSARTDLTDEQKNIMRQNKEKELSTQYATSDNRAAADAAKKRQSGLTKEANKDPELRKTLELNKLKNQQNKEIENLKLNKASPEQIKEAERKHVSALMEKSSDIDAKIEKGEYLPKSGLTNIKDGLGASASRVGKNTKAGIKGTYAAGKKVNAGLNKGNEGLKKMGNFAKDKLMAVKGDFYKVIFSLFITMAFGIFIFPTIAMAGLAFLTFLITKNHLTNLFTL